MQDSESDRELLERYAATGGNTAFRVLVDRYSGLVFHTAQRTLGDHSLAQDVSQRVFVSLAKKAGQVARSGAPLPSWLHRATLLEAKAMLRSESRHVRRKEALMKAPIDPPESGDSAWHDALPHLDAAIDSLPESDRHVLLMHFVNELTFSEIARRVGRSSAAVQKQSRRALEKLQQVLGRKGIALSIGALTAGLTTEMTKASPVLLAPVLGASIGKTTTSLFAVKKTTIAAVSATVLLCGVPLAYQQTRIQKLEARITDAMPLAELVSRSRTAGSRRHSHVSFLQRLARDLKARESDVPRYVSAVDHVESLSNDELIALALETVASSLSFDDREMIIGQIFEPLATRNPELALDVLLHRIPEPYRSKSYRVEGLIQGILRNYSNKQAQAALAWFERNLGTIRSIPGRDGFPENQRENDIRQSLANGFILTDPSQAIEILRPVQPGMLPLFFQQFSQSRWPDIEKDPRPAIQVARGLLSERIAGEVIADLASPFLSRDQKGFTDFKKFDHLLDSAALTEGELFAFSLKAAKGLLSIDPRINLEAGILHYRAWLESRDYGRTDAMVGRALAEVAGRKGGPAAYDVLLRRDDLGIGEEAVGGFLQGLADQHRPKAEMELIERLVNGLEQPERFHNLVERIKTRSSQ